MARQSGFEHVRIQTHGMRLASRKYCEQLIEAGVDEFFVSVAASDASAHDAITDGARIVRKNAAGTRIA